MALFVCGINHKTASIAMREKLYFSSVEAAQPLCELVDQEIVREVVLLSTCNRTELYCETENVSPLLAWFGQRACSAHSIRQFEQVYYPIPSQSSANDSIIQAIYCHQELDAVRHIMRVACGLDSMVVGESQILRQMKNAFALACKIGSTGPQLQRLFQYIFATTKQVRTYTGIGSHPVSMAYVAVDLAKRIFSDLSQVKALVIGAGEMIELSLRYLKSNGVSQLLMVNRTYAKASILAKKYQGKAVIFSELLNVLPQADIIISATGTTLPILGKGSFERALKIRKRRPMLVVDLAVPRDVEPQVVDLSDVYLYCIDDLEEIITRNLDDRLEAAQFADQLIELQAEHFMCWLRSLDSVATIRHYRRKIEKYQEQEVAKALQLLYLGESPEKVIMELARNLSNKIMHAPTTQMRQAGYEGQLEILAVARQLLAIDSDN